MSTEIGRLADIDQPLVHDAPNRTVEAIITMMDRQTDGYLALLAGLDVDPDITRNDWLTSYGNNVQKLDLIL